MVTIGAVILSAALLLAMILNLALKPPFSAKLMLRCMVIAVLGGLVYYGAGLYAQTRDLPLTVLRAPVMVLRMFVGVNELGAIASSRLVSTRAGLLGFWLLHLLAFYTTASAVLNALGGELLRGARDFLSRRGDLTLIYGVSDESVALGRGCLAAGGAVVLAAESVSAELTRQLNEAGMAVLAGPELLSEKTLRRLRPEGRKLSVYALDEADERNLAFALRLRGALEARGAKSENTRVTLPGAEDILAPMLQASGTAFGFGSVNVFDRAMLAARALVRAAPPWELVGFDEKGRATEDFSCLIAGFGPYGQAALRQLAMNGQFAGARFRAAVFTPDFDREGGRLRAECPELFSRYEIDIREKDARSEAFYRYVEERIGRLKLIVLATGDEALDRELSDSLTLCLRRRRAERIRVVRCGAKGVRWQERVGGPMRTIALFSRALLSAEEADRGAILLNARYDDSPRSDWEKWLGCDYFSKTSSRAAADFAPAFLRAAHRSRAALIEKGWELPEETLRNLGETEHMRWNAFHFAMGYRPMSETEFRSRADALRRGEAPDGFRAGKNSEGRTHVCLVDWDELPAVSGLERELTGRYVDYQQADVNNVLALPELLRAEEERAAT